MKENKDVKWCVLTPPITYYPSKIILWFEVNSGRLFL